MKTKQPIPTTRAIKLVNNGVVTLIHLKSSEEVAKDIKINQLLYKGEEYRFVNVAGLPIFERVEG